MKGRVGTNVLLFALFTAIGLIFIEEMTGAVHGGHHPADCNDDAIVAFSREAAYVTDRAVLLERMEEELLKYADASSVAILLDDRGGRYGAVSENDPALLALRAQHDVLDHRAPTPRSVLTDLAKT